MTEPLPEHDPNVLHERDIKGNLLRWANDKCERCRRQAIGQHALLGVLTTDKFVERFYRPK